MARPLSIAIEPTKALSSPDEAALLRRALDINPSSPLLRAKLCSLLNDLDQFDEVVALLAPALPSLDFDLALELVKACFGQRDADHLDLADLAVSRALATANSNSDLALALADRASIRLRHGRVDDAIALLYSAIALDAKCNPAFRRLALQLLRLNEHDAADRLTLDLLAMGVHRSRILATRVAVLAAMGQEADAKAMMGLEHFLHHAKLSPPTGMGTNADFNAALAAELTNSFALRHDKFGTASVDTDRLDAPTAAENPLWAAILQKIARKVEDWANALPPTDHIWLAARPERAVLRSWCVITGNDGYERWHMHPGGWISGGYYPMVPSGLDQMAEPHGHIAFGLPSDLLDPDQPPLLLERSIQPEMGDLILFPSHVYHRTFPHGLPGHRICIAFDIMPV